jgi:O-antigen/teichoic acid export membrane protein
MPFKTFAILVFVAIIFSLGSALFHLVKGKDEEQSRKTAKALTLRIGLSLLLFVFLIIAMALGLFQPTGIGARIQQQHQAPSIEQPKQ